MNEITKLPAWERLFKRIVWKQIGEIEGKRILDFGSGEGITANYFARKNEVIAIEPSEEMHISGMFKEVDIENAEVDIESAKVDIRNKLTSFSDKISEKTINHTLEIFSKCGKEDYFGRTIVVGITGLKPSGASKLIRMLVDSEVIVPVTGHGKGKYRFQL